ncbi:MAG: M14 family metallopeptidase [Candidatus Paceibacterota bacterium]|jgi:predicted deacylase
MQRIPRKYIIAIIVIALVGAASWLYFKRDKALPEAPLEEVAKEVSAYKVIGHSVEGRKIESFRYGKGEKEIVFVGGIHGGYEWNTVFLAYKLMDYLDQNPDAVPAGVSVTVIPSANPDGMYRVTGKEGRFALTDVSTNETVLASGRFNGNNVDVNRNFDCKWKPTSMWRSKTVSAGTKAFSEPEAAAIRDYAHENRPSAFVFWHSQANAAYASECENGVLSETQSILKEYSVASGYPAKQTFDSYVITGESADWLASQGIPAISVELKTHETIEWEKNLLGVKALIGYYEEKI